MEQIDRILQWRFEKLKDQDGIITGSDAQQEWMLPWWWACLRKSNDYPVVFADFGMSKEAREWCRERGELVEAGFPKGHFISKEELPQIKIALWESIYRPERLWTSRKTWFTKPLAMLQTPFLRTVWLDLDCEVKGSLKEVFPTCENRAGFSAVREPTPSVEKQEKLGLLQPGQKLYNTGVVVFKRNSPLIREWSKWALEKNGDYPGNQTLLADLIWKEKWEVYELQPCYNWRMMLGQNPDAVIIHWVSVGGKNWIKESLAKLGKEGTIKIKTLGQ